MNLRCFAIVVFFFRLTENIVMCDLSCDACWTEPTIMDCGSDVTNIYSHGYNIKLAGITVCTTYYAYPIIVSRLK